jgi:hypothetical protein
MSAASSGCWRGDDDKIYRYPGGQVKLHEEYAGGKLVRSVWHLPTGEPLRVTNWDNGTGTWYMLDDAGRIVREAPAVNELLHGWAIDFEYTDSEVKAHFVHYVRGEQQEPGDGVPPSAVPTSAPQR